MNIGLVLNDVGRNPAPNGILALQVQRAKSGRRKADSSLMMVAGGGTPPGWWQDLRTQRGRHPCWSRGATKWKQNVRLCRYPNPTPRLTMINQLALVSDEGVDVEVTRQPYPTLINNLISGWQACW